MTDSTSWEQFAAEADTAGMLVSHLDSVTLCTLSLTARGSRLDIIGDQRRNTTLADDYLSKVDGVEVLERRVVRAPFVWTSLWRFAGCLSLRSRPFDFGAGFLTATRVPLVLGFERVRREVLVGAGKWQEVHVEKLSLAKSTNLDLRMAYGTAVDTKVVVRRQYDDDGVHLAMEFAWTETGGLSRSQQTTTLRVYPSRSLVAEAGFKAALGSGYSAFESLANAV